MLRNVLRLGPLFVYLSEQVLAWLTTPAHGALWGAGGGLSSSAAIVCSSALAVAAALDLTSHLTKGAVSEFTCTAERYVGVTSGGMDQAISVMGMPGLALLVEFNPVSSPSCYQVDAANGMFGPTRKVLMV
jgi:hypothetical protein